VNRFRSYYPNDDQESSLGDGSFRGVDMRQDPGSLPDGFVAEAMNMRFNRGIPEPRLGIRLLSWAQPFLDDDPGLIYPYGTFPEGNVAGAGVFADPISGEASLIIATTAGVYRARPGTMSASVPLPAGETIPEQVQLIQTYNGMVMLRGADLDPLYMNDLATGFQTLPEATNDPANVAIPAASWAVYVSNRLFVIDGRTDALHVDTVFVSDFGTVFDVLEGSLAYNSFKINQGSSDRLVALYPFNDTTLICAKSDSVYVVSNVYGTNEELSTNARLEPMTKEYGCRAPGSFVSVGADVWFLAHKRGIVSVRQTEQNKLQGVDLAASLAISPLIERINWEYAHNAVAAYYNNRVYFAVPLDNSTVNNTVLVYDTQTQAWAGYDQGDAISIKAWVRMEIAGVVRLLCVSTSGFIGLYEDGYFDQTSDNSGLVVNTSVQTLLRTRGYGGNVSGRKRFVNVELTLSTWWPQFTLTANTDGVRESRDLTTITPFSRVAYRRPHNAADWDPTNADDDFHTPYREDYAIIIPEGGIDPGDNGLSPDLHQELQRSWTLRETGRYVQIEITGTQGRTCLLGIKVDALRGSPRHSAQV